MGMFSWSANKRHHGGHLGSSYYKGRGLLGSLMDVIGSRSHSHPNDAYNNMQNYIPMQNNAMVNICSRCRSEIPLGSAFCLECGEMRRMLHCTGCGEVLQANAKFCGKCGKKIE